VELPLIVTDEIGRALCNGSLSGYQKVDGARNRRWLYFVTDETLSASHSVALPADVVNAVPSRCEALFGDDQ
jgi:hypothetical protein